MKGHKNTTFLARYKCTFERTRQYDAHFRNKRKTCWLHKPIYEIETIMCTYFTILSFCITKYTTKLIA